ncbi:MAG: ABC transporter substrate-binding protein, partial [Clostridiales bacterium]|nr:ABC transporter substrate-binding protein [Clostridiales bacterium]
ALSMAVMMAASMIPSVPVMAEEAKGSVYYLNFKPEQADQWAELGEKYTEETGVPVTVVTAASGTYESTLKSEMAKDEAPTLFQVNGPVGLASWKDYCYDLKDTEIYKQLTSEEFALTNEDGSVPGIAYVIETYGLIYNKALLNDYFETDGAVVKSVEEINSFETLKAVADDIQAKKDDLGIEGAFTSAGFDASSDWRFKTHLANLPVYYEYVADGINSTDAIKGTYLENFKNIFDLYITDSTCEPSVLSSKTGEDAASEFALGEAVFYQNGTWAYNDIKDNEVADEDMGMLPIYIGVEGEENQGLCTGSENYWCVNSKASEEDIQATLDFLNWVITSDEGRTSLSQEMGFVTPFKTFDKNFESENPLVVDANKYIADGKTSVAWNFTTMPSEEWKNQVGSAMLEYAQGTGEWDAVEKAFVDGWATEYAAAHAE